MKKIICHGSFFSLKRIIHFGVLLFLFASFISGFYVFAQEDKLKVEFVGDKTQFSQNEEVKINKVTLEGNPIEIGKLNKDNFTFKTDGIHTITSKTGDFLTLIINGKEGDVPIEFTYTDDEKKTFTGTKKIKLVRAFDLKSVKLKNGANDDIPLGGELKMLSGEELEIKVSVSDLNSEPFSNAALKLKFDKPNIVRFSSDTFSTAGNSSAKIIAETVRDTQKVKVSVFNGDLSLGEFTISVSDKIKDLNTFITTSSNDPIIQDAKIELEEGKSVFYNLTLLGLSNTSYNETNIPEGSITVEAEKKNLVKIEVKNNILKLTPQILPNQKIDANSLISTITAEVKQLGKIVVSRKFTAQIKQQNYFIELDKTPVILTQNGISTVSATVKDLSRNPVSGVAFSWELANPTDSQWLTVSQEGNNATIVWNNPINGGGQRPLTALVNVTATTPDAKTITKQIVVRMLVVEQFAMMKVKLNVLDKRTVRDLFGSTTDDEYYVVSVRMYNNLKDDKRDEYIGASILVYNGSFEVAVLLQKQYDKGSKSGNPTKNNSYNPDGKWYDLTPDDLAPIRAKDGNFIDKRSDKNSFPVIGYGEEAPCQGTITYRPLTFEMAVNTVDARDGRRFRSRAFAALSLAATGGSFLAATNVLTGNSVVPVLDKFSNLLIPGMEKVFPSLKEVHRQNIVSMAMKPIEEIPFGTDLTRVVLIPKKSIRGILQDHKVRISQICPYFFKVEVAVIKRGDRTEVQQGTQQ